MYNYIKSQLNKRSVPNTNINPPIVNSSNIPLNSQIVNTQITAKLFSQNEGSKQTVIQSNTSNNTNNINAKPYGPAIPTVPSVPKVPVVPSVPSVPSIPKIPAAPILKIPDFVEPKLLDTKALEKRGSLLEEIRTDNPLSRLKKITDVKKPELPVLKKKEIRSMTANPVIF
jgi:hypothetical protein